METKKRVAVPVTDSEPSNGRTTSNRVDDNAIHKRARTKSRG